MVSPMRRCPFSENIDRRVEVALVCRAAVWARPHAGSERDVFVDPPAHRAQFGRGEPCVDVMHDSACRAGNVMQNINKAGKAKVRHFAAPQRFHATQVERFQRNEVVLRAEFACQRPMKRLPLVRHTLVDTVQMLSGLPPIMGALLLVRQLAVGLRNRPQAVFEGLWCLMLSPITAGEIRRQPKVKACAFTCHDSDNGLFVNDTREVDVHVPKRIAFDGHRFDGAVNLSGLGVLIDRRANLETIPVKEFPAGLCQRERLRIPYFAEGGRANASGGLFGCTGLDVRKEGLIAFVDARGDLLDRLGAKLLPPGVLGQLLQLGKMCLQRVEREMLLVHPVVAAMQSDAMVVYGTTNVNLAMQPFVALTTIQFVRERLAALHYVIPSRFACSRMVISSLDVMLMPDFSASASNRRLASVLSRKLVAFGFFSILQVYHVFAVRCTKMCCLRQQLELSFRKDNALISPT